MSTQIVDTKKSYENFKETSIQAFKRYWTNFGWLASHIIDALLGRRVSLIHLTEAKERFRSLNAIIRFHEEVINDGELKSDPDKVRVIQSCRLELEDAEQLLTRDQKDLNDLWRILTRVRNLIMENIFDDYGLVQQLDYCREEAFRLDVAQDPVVSDMLQKLAEATDETNTFPSRIKRHVRALNERFNTIRTNRIFDQYIKMRIYRTALVVLAILSIVVIVLTPVLIDFENKDEIKNALFPKYEFYWSSNYFTVIVDAVLYHTEYLVALCKANVLAFVFIGGLIGGFFSVVLRVQTQVRVKGEDAYFRLYVLSRPLVGALAAMMVYILFMGGFVTNELVAQLGVIPDPKVFGFAFLSGFSERIVFPNFR
jgi:hypothetical protein